MQCELKNSGVNISIASLDVYYVLTALRDATKKTYCFPKQVTILSYLWKWRQRKMSRSSLNVHLNNLVKIGLITRIRRHYRDAKKGFVLRSTAYYIHGFQHKLLKFLKKIVKTASTLVHVQKSGQYHYKQIMSIRKDCMESGISPEIGQKPPPDGEQIDLKTIKAFNLKLKNDLIRQKIGR